MNPLRTELRRIEGRSYPAYRDLRGLWGPLCIDRVQGDPFASPSHLSFEVETGIPEDLWSDTRSRHAAEDWLLRRFGAHLQGRKRGSGKSGLLSVYRPGPEVVERSALRLRGSVATVRLRAGLPARGRRIDGHAAAAMLLEDLPRSAAWLEVGDDPDLRAHVHSVLRQQGLRDQLARHGLIAFLANGSVLPRESGVSQAPLAGAIPLYAPDALTVELDTPDGPVRGLGIRTGVTVITGGGFHGKSTVLAALQRGHLDHVPGDGREGVVAHPNTVKVRAEDGRSVHRVDISAFLRTLPGGRSTTAFTTEDASGSTSQAAAIVEALEAGAKVLLLDEDTSATNLLVRDSVMRALIPDDEEPITPFVQRVRQLDCSTVLVIGGVSDYLPVADTVIAMHTYAPRDVTALAHSLRPEAPTDPGPLPIGPPRTPTRFQVDRVRARDTRAVDLDRNEIDLTAVEQVLDAAHAASLGHALALLGGLADGKRTLPQLLDALHAILDDEGPEALSTWSAPPGDLLRPRRHEIAAALCRLRKLGFDDTR